MSFEQFNFNPSVMAGVQALGYVTPDTDSASMLSLQFYRVEIL